MTDLHTPTTTTTSTATTTTGDLGRWAREVAGPSTATAGPAPARPTLSDRLLGAALVASPLAMTAWFLVEPSVLPREDPAVFLGSIAQAPDRYLVATGLVALAGALGVVAAVALFRLLRSRLPVLAPVLGVLGVLSGFGLLAQVGFRMVTLSHVEDGTVPAAAVDTYASFQSSASFDTLLLPGLAFGGLATLLMLVALLRSRVVPLWVAPLLVVSAVLASGELPDPVTVGGAALGVVGNLTLARALLRR